MVQTTTLKRSGLTLAGVAVAAALAVLLYGAVPVYTGVGAVEVTLGLLLFAGASTVAGRFASSAVTDYDVAEVEVDAPITRDGEGGLPFGGRSVSANDVVDLIERADADDGAAALVVKLNTPGGAVVPSEDIRAATERFDGPTVAYAEDLAASGGYWIASGADEFHARRGAVVGSIGVNGTQLGLQGLAERAGLDYRRFVAGEYKDTPARWRELSEDEREYYQGLLDGYYDQFVDTVAEGRDLDPEFVRDTEARLYLGEEAHERGLVDHCGPREEMEDRLADRLGVEALSVEEFEAEQSLPGKLRTGAQQTARAFGAGVASVLVGDGEPDIRV